MARTSPKRRAAARKAAATRRRRAAARSASAKKAARTRRRRGNPRRSTRKGMVRKTARRAYNPRRSTRKGQRRRTARRAYTGTRRRRRRSNPRFDLQRIFKDTLGLAVPLGLTLVARNYLANWPAKKDEAGNTLITVSQRVGPLFPIGFDLLALWAAPRFLFKGKMSRYRRDFTTGVSVFLALDVLNLLTWSARRQWSFDNAKLIPVGSDTYPEWTDLLTLREPQAMLKGAPFHPGHQFPHSHAHSGLRGPGAVAALPQVAGTFYDTTSGRWLVQAEA